MTIKWKAHSNQLFATETRPVRLTAGGRATKNNTILEEAKIANFTAKPYESLPQHLRRHWAFNNCQKAAAGYEALEILREACKTRPGPRPQWMNKAQELLNNLDAKLKDVSR